ncbi:MAG: carboxypeptidase regulatory-like domain-containing protein [Armatimonadota bacterium]|nr:carboxypeptidase regulatory-like domain-containing protein [Armatimonadota bacterium]
MKRIVWFVSVAVVMGVTACGGGKRFGKTPAPPPPHPGTAQGRLVPAAPQGGRLIARIPGARARTELAAQVQSSGFFRITNVPAGPQVLTLEDRERMRGAVIVCLVRPNEINDVGLVETQPLGLLSGIVREVDAEGNSVGPIAGAWVTAQPIEAIGDTLSELPERPYFTDRTNGAGAYSLLLPVGAYLVHVRHPDYEPATDTATVEALIGVSLNFGLQRRPRDASTVFGRVQARVDDQIVPVPGALVALVPRSAEPSPIEIHPDHLTVGQIISSFANPLGSGAHPRPGDGIRPQTRPERLRMRFTFTSADGSYEINDVPPGRYEAFAYKVGFGRDEKEVNVLGNSRIEVNFLLSAHLGKVVGQVTDATNSQPLGEALVFAVRRGDHFFIWDGWQKDDDRPHWHHGGFGVGFGSGGSPGGGASGRPPAGGIIVPPMPPVEPPYRAGTITDPNGHYELILPTGEYFLVATKEGYEWQAAEVTITEGQTVTQDFALYPSSQPPGGDLSQLSVELKVKPEEVPVGETVHLMLEVENQGRRPVTLQFSTPLAADFVISREGQEIWRFSRHTAVILGDASTLVVPPPVTLRPGQKVSFPGTWQQVDDDGNQVPPGEYTAVGILLTRPEIVAREPRRIRITSAED